jgi:hypothetical protein
VVVDVANIEGHFSDVLIMDMTNGFIQRCTNPELEEHIGVQGCHVTKDHLILTQMLDYLCMDDVGTSHLRTFRFVTCLLDGRYKQCI